MCCGSDPYEMLADEKERRRKAERRAAKLETVLQRVRDDKQNGDSIESQWNRFCLKRFDETECRMQVELECDYEKYIVCETCRKIFEAELKAG